MLFVKLDEFAYIYIAYSITIGHEKLLSFNIPLFDNRFKPPSRHGIVSRIHQRYFPIFAVVVMNLDAVVLDIDSHVAVVQKIIGKPFFDIVSLISEAYDELFVAIIGKMLHDMPQYWFPPDFDHWFWLDGRFFG
jgi:hypothetical protein